MGHELPELILEYREVQKLKSTYVDVLPLAVQPRTPAGSTPPSTRSARRPGGSPPTRPQPAEHPGPHAARRGDPSRHSFPRPGGKFVVADYSQIELRLLAHLSGDPAFIEAFRAGEDIHRHGGDHLRRRRGRR